MGLAAMPAHALVVNVGGINYNVDTVLGTFAANETLLKSQVWWGDPGLAFLFASTVNNQIVASSNRFPPDPLWGPFFSFQKSPESDPNYVPQFTNQAKTWNDATSIVNEISTPVGTFDFGNGPVTYSWTYATATLVPTVPGPLPIFGAVAAFGYSRRLKKRIQGVKKRSDVFHFQ